MEKRRAGRNPVIRLRPPEPKDALALMDFFNGLMEEGDLQLNHDRKVGYEEEAEWLKKKLEEIYRGEALLFVAEEGGKIIGAVDVRRGKFKESHTAELGVSVGRDHRGIGLGTRMIRVALKEAGRLGIKLVWLQVFSTNRAAIRLYKKLGFKKDATLKKMLFYRGKYVDKIMMSRPFGK